MKVRSVACNRFFFLFLFLCVSLHGQRRLYVEEDTSVASLALYNSGKLRDAIEKAKEEIAGEDARVESYIVLASSYLQFNNYKASYEASKKGREDTQKKYNPELLEIQAIACYHLGRNLEALSLLQTYLRVTSQEKDVANIYYYMGEIYARLTQFNRADIALSAALSIRPSEVNWWVRLGYVREKARSFYDARSTQYALEAYKKALELDRNDTDAIAGINRLQGASR